MPLKLESPAFENDEMIPLEYTCDGANISPPKVVGRTDRHQIICHYL